MGEATPPHPFSKSESAHAKQLLNLENLEARIRITCPRCDPVFEIRPSKLLLLTTEHSRNLQLSLKQVANVQRCSNFYSPRKGPQSRWKAFYLESRQDLFTNRRCSPSIAKSPLYLDPLIKPFSVTLVHVDKMSYPSLAGRYPT